MFLGGSRILFWHLIYPTTCFGSPNPKPGQRQPFCFCDDAPRRAGFGAGVAQEEDGAQEQQVFLFAFLSGDLFLERPETSIQKLEAVQLSSGLET